VLYLTTTANPTPAPNIIVPATAPASPTSQIYTIEAGDTFSGLSEKFHVSQDDLRAANPDINPNTMTIGATLVIPGSSPADAAGSTLTPVPVPVSQVICHPTADNGLWCFALIRNDTPDGLENVSAQITLLDKNKAVLASQTAFTPLDIIPPGASLPAYVFFPGLSAAPDVQVQLLSAIPSNNPQHLQAALNNTVAQINWGGSTARVSGQVSLPAGSPAATLVWVAAVAYDRDGRVIGVKRWEGGSVQPGGSLQFNFEVPSLGSAIDSVEFFVEAK
jgi:LysM repeat protein